MRTITTSVTVYAFDELAPDAQERAVQHVAEREAARGWDCDELELIESTMVYTLAGRLNAPGWDTCGEGDFPGIDRVTVCEWDLDRGQVLGLSGWLDRDNAPGLPWVDGIESVQLTAIRRGGTEVDVVTCEPDCTCPAETWSHEPDCAPTRPPVAPEQVSGLRDAVTEAIHAAWLAGRDELAYRSSAEYARDRAENDGFEFTVNGELYL
jgi:hypothetical protein